MFTHRSFLAAIGFVGPLLPTLKRRLAAVTADDRLLVRCRQVVYLVKPYYRHVVVEGGGAIVGTDQCVIRVLTLFTGSVFRSKNCRTVEVTRVTDHLPKRVSAGRPKAFLLR